MDMAEEPAEGEEEEEEEALQDDLRALRGLMEGNDDTTSTTLLQPQGRDMTDDPEWARRVRALGFL